MTWTSKPDFKKSHPKIELCKHERVAFQHKNVHFKDNPIHYLEVIGFCTDCKKRVQFHGAETGRALYKPSMTGDGFLIRLPFVCEEDLAGNNNDKRNET